MRHLLLIVSLCFVCGCSSGSDNTPAANIPTPKPSPTIPAEDEKVRNVKRIAQDKAIAEFVAKDYKGWALNGISPTFEACRWDDEDLCYLHLANGSKTKVVPVLVREFEKPDKSRYWLVFEASALDLIRAKLVQINERTE